MAERYPIYAEADVTVESRDVPHEVIVGAVIDASPSARLPGNGGHGRAARGGMIRDGATALVGPKRDDIEVKLPGRRATRSSSARG